jgi:hypothetical protein
MPAGKKDILEKSAHEEGIVHDQYSPHGYQSKIARRDVINLMLVQAEVFPERRPPGGRMRADSCKCLAGRDKSHACTGRGFFGEETAWGAG